MSDATGKRGVLRDPLRAGASALLVLVIMIGGSLVLWIGVPLGWLVIGGQIQGSSGSIGTAVAVMLVGAPLTIIVFARGLSWLNHKYVELSAPPTGGVPRKGPLEAVVMVCAVVAVVVFVFWFLIIAGPGPSLAPQN